MALTLYAQDRTSCMAGRAPCHAGCRALTPYTQGRTSCTAGGRAARNAKVVTVVSLTVIQCQDHGNNM